MVAKALFDGIPRAGCPANAQGLGVKHVPLA
jgi:hypothetical protein